MGQLKIGHGKSSMTFRPEVVYSEDLKCFLIDLAGFMDMNGPIFDLLNCFIIKYIFEHVKTVKFLLPFTLAEIDSGRGRAITELLGQLSLMTGRHLVNFVDSFIPVITKCSPQNSKKNQDRDLICNDTYEVIK